MAQLQSQRQAQSQKQIQKMSQVQIQAMNYLAMTSRDLRQEIFKAVEENPALEIVADPKKTLREEYSTRTSSAGTLASDSNQLALEAQADRGESLQQHLMAQLDLMKISRDEYELSQKLIYNLDENGCYGSMLAPESLLDKSRPAQNKKMLDRCIDRIQRMDPIGTCSRTLEESLFVQARIAGDAPPLALFILDGQLQLLSPPQADRVLKNLKEYLKAWHAKKFAPEIILDKLELTEETCAQAIKYITSLNPRPAREYISDTSQADFLQPDIMLSVTKEPGSIPANDYEKGLVRAPAGSNFHFQIKYSNGDLPEVQLAPDYNFNSNLVQKAKEFIHLLKYRQSSIILLGSSIVNAQMDFFIKGPGNLKALTRRQLAKELHLHESTISRMTAKKSSRSIDVMGQLYPASYFFVSGPSLRQAQDKLGSGTTSQLSGIPASSESIKFRISKLLENSSSPLSDQAITNRLQAMGIKISRRTVNKYRNQLGLDNSYGK